MLHFGEKDTQHALKKRMTTKLQKTSTIFRRFLGRRKGPITGCMNAASNLGVRFTIGNRMAERKVYSQGPLDPVVWFGRESEANKRKIGVQ